MVVRYIMHKHHPSLLINLHVLVNKKHATNLLCLQYAELSAVSPDNPWMQNMQKSLSPTQR